jgi:TRAP-type uncharacterized transport system substrate-binding protein
MEVTMQAFSNNFAKILGILGVGLRDRRPQDRFKVWATHIENPAEALRTGEVQVAFYTPPWVGLMDANGSGFAEGGPTYGLRSIASFPHFDQYAFAVRKELGIKSFQELIQRAEGLRISLHFAGPRFIREVLKAYEGDFDEFEQRGNTWVQLEYATWQKGWTHLIKGGELDGVFDEGLMTKRWLQVSDEIDLEYLPIDGPQLDLLEAYGMKRGFIPKGRLRGVERDLPTIDMEGWVMVCDESLPEDLVYDMTKTLDEVSGTIDASFSPGQGMTGKLAEHPMWEKLDIPVHPGADRYYREQGHTPR